MKKPKNKSFSLLIAGIAVALITVIWLLRAFDPVIFSIPHNPLPEVAKFRSVKYEIRYPDNYTRYTGKIPKGKWRTFRNLFDNSRKTTNDIGFRTIAEFNIRTTEGNFFSSYIFDTDLKDSKGSGLIHINSMVFDVPNAGAIWNFLEFLIKQSKKTVLHSQSQ